MALIVTILGVFILLLASEAWWRTRPVHDEFSRKFVHITVGSFVAFWPFFLSWNQIRLLSLAFLVIVAFSKYLHIFGAIHSVQRPTLGEVFFALAVGAITYATHDKWIYAVALLQMSLADGLAAVVGLRYGQKNRYTVFGAYKSIIGTLTFFVVALILLFGYQHYSGVSLYPLYVLGLSLSASLIENLGAYGLDNLLVPLLVAIPLASR